MEDEIRVPYANEEGRGCVDDDAEVIEAVARVMGVEEVEGRGVFGTAAAVLELIKGTRRRQQQGRGRDGFVPVLFFALDFSTCLWG